MEKSNYKLFFYLKDKPINLNLKSVPKTQSPPHETRAKLFNQDIQKNIYTKSKQNYEFLVKKNKNIFILNKKGGKLPSKEYIQALVNFDKKIKTEDFSLLPFPPHKKENNKSVEELRRIQRNKVTMRRIEYSMKVKHTSTKKRSKYNIKKVIIIQKWIRGFLIRNLLSNLGDLEDIKNEFFIHIKKFCFLKYLKDFKNVVNYMIKKNIDDMDVKKENERYIDEDSFLEYNTRYNNNNKKNKNKNSINNLNNLNNNLLFFNTKDSSEKNNLNTNNLNKIYNNNIPNINKTNNYNNDSNSNILLTSGGSGGVIFNNININNNNLFKSNDSSISLEETNKNIFEKNKTKEENNINDNNIIKNNLKTEINEDIDLLNNNQLFIRRQKFNKKFLEEITNAPSKFNTEANNIDINVDIKEEKNINKNNKNINSIKSNNNSNNNNQLLSISNPTNSTLDSNTLNINRKLNLEENLNLNNLNNNISNIIKENIIKKPINELIYITKNRILLIKDKKEDTSINNINLNLNESGTNNDISDMNINVLKVVNNDVDELNNSIKNIVKEELISSNDNKDIINQNKSNNIFNNNKSLRELLKLDQQNNNNNININNDNDNNNINNDNNIIEEKENKEESEVLNKMSIEAIKEVKEEYEYDEEKDNDIDINNKEKKNEEGFNIGTNDININIGLDIDNNKNNEEIRYEKNIGFSIIPKKKYDKRKIIIIYMIEKQIKYGIKPYIFNMFKRFWIDKLSR